MPGPINGIHLDISALPDQAETIRWGVPAWQSLWRGSPLIKIYDVNGCRIAIIPIEFLSHGSVSEAWQQIIAVIGCCVRSQGARLYRRSRGEWLPCQPLEGPYGKRVGRLPEPDDGEEPDEDEDDDCVDEEDNAEGQNSMSVSSRAARAGQYKFKVQLEMRDGICLATGTNSYHNVGAHIIPISRRDLYKMVLGSEMASSLYAVNMGILLSPNLHKSFHALQWAFFPRETDMVLHVFNTNDPDIAKLHGRVVPHSSFRVNDSRDFPDPHLLLFHYRQCVQMYFRYYSYEGSARDGHERNVGRTI